jgi:hypothetical protein
MTVTAAVLAAVALWAAWRIGAAYAALSASHALVALQTELDECMDTIDLLSRVLGADPAPVSPLRPSSVSVYDWAVDGE